jgi:glycosyltransferase involved in cell wall biosynthesis
MRIGVLPYLDPLGGGTYQHSLNVLRAVRQLGESGGDQFVVLVRDLSEARRAGVAASADRLQPVSWRGEIANRARRLVGRRARALLRTLRRDPGAPTDVDAVALKPGLTARFRRLGLDLVYYPTLDPFAFEVDVPAVVTIHDLQPILQPDLPEFVGQTAAWVYLLRNSVRRALLLVVDSEIGREDVLAAYGHLGLTADRVRILPYLPAPYLGDEPPERTAARVRDTYRLPGRFVFYPAQFWPHKNHKRLLEAIALLRRRDGLDVDLVLCGGHGGELRERTFADFRTRAAELGAADLVHYLGFVPDRDMVGLYRAAEALAFPTFFGPTNIPVVEAWSVGCPVLTSDIRGVREHAGDAAVLADPSSVDAIAAGLRRLWTEPELRASLIERGRARLAAYGADDFRRRLAGILEEAKSRVREAR